MEYYRIKNLEEYQDLKKTKSYAKIYFTILSDPEFSSLTNSQRWLYIGMILLACQHKNKLPTDSSYIYHQVCHRSLSGGGGGIREVRVGIQCLLEKGLIYKYIYKYIDNNDLNKKNETNVSSKMKELRTSLKGIVKQI